MVGIHSDYGDTTRLRKFPGSHLSAPLTYFPQRLIIQHYSNQTEAPIEKLRAGVRTLKFLKDRFPGCCFKEDPSAIYAHFFRRCTKRLTPADRNTQEVVNELSQFLFTCCQDSQMSLKSIEKQSPGLGSLELKFQEDMIKEVIMSVLEAYKCYKFVVEIRGSVQGRVMMEAEKDIMGPFNYSGYTVYHQGEMVVCIQDTGPSESVVLNYDQWVMICDTVVSRFITLLVCELNARKPFDILPRPDFLRELYEWGDEMLHEDGIAAYAVIGEFESIVTSCFVSFADSDPLNLGADFIASVRQTALEQEAEYGIRAGRTTKLMTLLRKQASVNVLSEVFGLRKHWGNPMVEAAASGRAVQDKLNEDLPISGVALTELLAAFNRMITLSFIKIHNRWPACEFKERKDGVVYPLMKAQKSNNTTVPENDPEHDHLDWALLVFHCNCVADTYENQLETLSDKSVSLPVSELDNIYYKGMIPNQKTAEGDSERRLILKFLQEEQMPVMDILKKIMTDKAPPDWFANSANMKGTEVKHLKARIFAVLTYELRQYFAVTEDMIKRHLFPYNPHQTMTMNETELLVKLRGMTKQMDVDSTSRTLNVMHIVDFSKWNLRMRYENTCGVFQSIDNFLGFPGLIEKSHIIFEDMVNLVQDPYNPPENGVANTLSDTIWRLHTRGWEGQRQKGWTILTSALLSDLERVTGVHSEICGQGDNQVLLTQFTIPEQYKNAEEWIASAPQIVKLILDDYYKKLEIKCAGVGLKVKTAETCRSLFYMNYGKRLFFCGVELSMTLKRLSKAMTESNDAFPLTETRLKTSQGASYAAGLYSHPSPWPFIMSRFCTMLTLYESFCFNPLIGDFGKKVLLQDASISGRFFSILAKMPACLGGPSQQPFAAFLCRGHPDPLCEELVMLILKARSGCVISKSIIHCAIEGSWFRDGRDGDRSSLIMSPYSLNLNIPTSARSPISHAVLPALKSFCKNSSVSELLSLEVDEYEKKLLEVLSNLTPFNPLIANDIYSRSIVGQRQSFVDGLKNATSICRLVQDSPTNPIIDEIKRLEERQLVFWVNAVKLIVANQGASIPNNLRHDQLADKLREKSWGIQLTGVTVPHPLEIFSLLKADDDHCGSHEDTKDDGYLVFVRHSNNLFSPPGVDNGKVQMTRSRTGKPYLGSMITEGITSKQVVCKNPTKAWTDACKYNVMRQWITRPGSTLDRLLRDLIKSRTDADIEFLCLVTGRPSRISYVHRADFTATKKVCALTATSNMYSRIYTSSNRMGKYSTSDVNYHLPYGPAYLTFSYLLCLSEILSPESSWGRNDHQIYHAHVVVDDIPTVYDGEISVDAPKNSFRYPMKPPKMLYSSVKAMEFDDLTVNSDTVTFKDFNKASIRQCQMAYSNLLLGDSFIREIVKKELMEASITDFFQKRDIMISIGDLKLTGISGFVKALAQNMCLVMGKHRAQIANKSCFIYSMVDLMNGFSRGFWSSFCAAMAKPELIEKLYSLTEGSGRSYDGANQSSLQYAWQYAVAIEVYNIREAVRNYCSGDRLPFTLFAPNFNAARHLYAKFIEMCVWIYGVQFKAKKIKKAGRDISRAIHTQESFLACRAVVSRALEGGSLMFIKGMGAANALSVPLYNTNDPWIDRIRDVKFRSAPRTSPSGLKMRRPPYTRVPDITFIVSENEVMVPASECRCHMSLPNITDRIEGFYLRSGTLRVDNHIILDTVNRYYLSILKVVVLNDKLGSSAKVIAEHPLNSSIYVAPCRDITEYSPHTAGTYVPPELLDCVALDKVAMPAPSAMIGNVLKSSRSQSLFLSHMSRDNWNGMIFLLEDIAKHSETEEVEAIVRSVTALVESMDHVSWLMIVGGFRCKHNLVMAMSIVSSVFEVVTFNRSPFTQSCGHGALVGYRRRSIVGVVQPGVRVSRIQNSNRVKNEFKSGDLWEIPAIAHLAKSEQILWMQSVETRGDIFRLACDTYLPGWGVGKVGCEQEDLLNELSKLSSYHRDNMGIVYRTILSARGEQDKVTRSFVLNLSGGGGYQTLNQQMDSRIRCLILYDLIKDPPRSLKEISYRLRQSVGRSYVLELENGNRLYGACQVDRFYSLYSGALYCIMGHVIQHIGLGVNSSDQALEHFRIKKPGVHRAAELPLELELKPGVQTGQVDLRYAYRSRAMVLTLLLARTLLTAQLVPNTPLIGLATTMRNCGYIKMTEKWDKTVNVMWIPNDYNVRAVMTQLELCADDSHPVVITIDKKRAISILEHHYCDFITRAPWTGVDPEMVTLRVFEKRGYLRSLKNFHINLEETVDVAFERIDKGACSCYDCAVEEKILKDLGIPGSVLNMLYDEKVKESFQDVRFLM